MLADATRPSASHEGVVPAIARALGVADGVIQRAGRGAMADTLRAAPPLGAMVLLSRALRFVPR